MTLYRHAGTFDVSACMHWLFNTILALLTTYHTFAAGRCSHRGLIVIDSTAESASYMSTRDNHVVGVMSRLKVTNPFSVLLAIDGKLGGACERGYHRYTEFQVASFPGHSRLQFLITCSIKTEGKGWEKESRA